MYHYYIQAYLFISLIAIAFGVLIAFLLYLPATRKQLGRLSLFKAEQDEEQTRLLLPIVLSFICWLVVPIVVSYIVSQGATRLFSSRYLVTIVPPFFLLVGLGVTMLRSRIVQIALILLFLLVALPGPQLYYKSAQVEDWNSAVPWLEQRAQTSDGLVCYTNVQGCQIAVEYYLHAYSGPAHFTDDSPGAFTWQKMVRSIRLQDIRRPLILKCWQPTGRSIPGSSSLSDVFPIVKQRRKRRQPGNGWIATSTLWTRL